MCLNRYAEVAIKSLENLYLKGLVSYEGAKRIDIAVNQYIRALEIFLTAILCLAMKCITQVVLWML